MELNLDGLLEDLLDKNKHTGFAARLKKLDHEVSVEGLDFTGRFFYLPFRLGEVTIDEFIQYLCGKLVYFCIPRTIRDRAIAKMGTTGELEHIGKLWDEAKHLFAKASENRYRSGEPGELMLFIILEAVLFAPQIVSKMYLKTSEKMPVHGSDAIHISFDEDAEILRLYWGESKLYTTLSSAFDETCESIKSFREGKEADDRPARLRDIDIIRDHADIEDGPLKDALLKYFDPYEEESNRVEECHACFVGFNFGFLSRIAEIERDKVDDMFREEYIKRANSAASLFVEKIKSNGLDGHRFELFLLPFADVDEFRQAFMNSLK